MSGHAVVRCRRRVSPLVAAGLAAMLLMIGPSGSVAQQQWLPPTPAPPMRPTAPPQVSPAAPSVPYAFILSVQTPADPRQPIPVTIHLVDSNSRPAAAPKGLVVNLLITTLRDLQQAKSRWVREEAASIAARDRHPLIIDKVGTPPRVISGSRDIALWGLPKELAQPLLAEAASGPRASITIDASRSAVFELFQFPQGRDAVAINVNTSYTSTSLTLAVQAAHTLSAIRILSVAVPQKSRELTQPVLAAAQQAPKTIRIEVIRQNNRLPEGWWSYAVTASISAGVPPSECFVDLSVTGPLKFVDPDTGDAKSAATRLRLPAVLAPSATASLATFTNVMPTSIPRQARVSVHPPHCQDFTVEPTEVWVDIPPRPGGLHANPTSLTTYARTGSTTILFYVRDKQGVEMVPEMNGIQQDGQWQVVFSVVPQSAGVVDPPNYPLKVREAIAKAVVRWAGPARAKVSATLTTTSSPADVGGTATLLLMFPWVPFGLAASGAPLTQTWSVLRPLPDRRAACIAAGLAWGAGAFWLWYQLGPVIQEIGIGPVKLGFSSGEVAGSLWLAVIVIVAATPWAVRGLLWLIGRLHERLGWSSGGPQTSR